MPTVTLNTLGCTLLIISTVYADTLHFIFMFTCKAGGPLWSLKMENGNDIRTCGSLMGFFSLFLHLIPCGPFGVNFFHTNPPQLNGKHLTIAEKLLPLIHHKALPTVCSAVAPQYYLSVEWTVIEPGEAARTRGMSVCQACLLTSAAGQRDRRVTSFTFSVASTNISSTKAEADPVPEAEVALVYKFLL